MAEIRSSARCKQHQSVQALAYG